MSAVSIIEKNTKTIGWMEEAMKEGQDEGACKEIIEILYEEIAAAKKELAARGVIAI